MTDKPGPLPRESMEYVVLGAGPPRLSAAIG